MLADTPKLSPALLILSLISDSSLQYLFEKSLPQSQKQDYRPNCCCGTRKCARTQLVFELFTTSTLNDPDAEVVVVVTERLLAIF